MYVYDKSNDHRNSWDAEKEKEAEERSFPKQNEGGCGKGKEV